MHSKINLIIVFYYYKQTGFKRLMEEEQDLLDKIETEANLNMDVKISDKII